MIHSHPKVGMVAVVGAPDSRSGGERLVAFVVPAADEIIEAADISSHCESHLVSYKCPSEVRVIARLPMTGAHKPNRIALRLAARGAAQLPPE